MAVEGSKGREIKKKKKKKSPRGRNLAYQAERGWRPHAAGSSSARAQRSRGGGGSAPVFELAGTWEASQPATRAVARPRPPYRAPVRSARQPRERARRRTNTGSSSSSGRRSPGKHQSDARFLERAASHHSCWRIPAVGGRREASCCPVADRPPSPLPLPSPATSAASHGVGCLLCTAHAEHLAMRLLSLAIFRSQENVVPELS